MADTLGSLFGGLGSGGSMMNTAIAVLVGICVLVTVIAIAMYFYKRSLWNLDVEFKFMRSNGTLITAEWGKGMFDSKRGVVYLKRPGRGKKKIAMPPFDVKRYLQGTRTLTVIQIGLEQYFPVMPESYLEMVDDETGEKAALMNHKIDLTQSKSWKNQFERESKQAYSIMGLLQQYANFIGIGLIFMMNFVGFAILYMQIKGG